MFYAGGDSLLIGPSGPSADSSFQVKVTSIDGTVRDSIRVAGPGLGLDGLSVSPGGKWIVALVVQAGRGFWQVFDRSGKVADHVLNSCTCPGRITSDALWLTRSGQGFESIVRLGIDPATGKLASRQDTLLVGQLQQLQCHRRRLHPGGRRRQGRVFALGPAGVGGACREVQRRRSSHPVVHPDHQLAVPRWRSHPAGARRRLILRVGRATLHGHAIRRRT